MHFFLWEASENGVLRHGTALAMDCGGTAQTGGDTAGGNDTQLQPNLTLRCVGKELELAKGFEPPTA